MRLMHIGDLDLAQRIALPGFPPWPREQGGWWVIARNSAADFESSKREISK